MKQERKRLIINRRYQYRFIATFSAVCLAGILAGTAAAVYAVGTGLERGMYMGHIPVMSTGQIVLPIAVKTELTFMLAVCAFLGAVLFIFARRTQRMVDGFRSCVRMLREGRMDFCFDDESRHDFPELDAALNRMVSDNGTRLKKLKKILNKMEGPIALLNGPYDPGVKRRAVSELAECTGELSRAHDEFNL